MPASDRLACCLQHIAGIGNDSDNNQTGQIGHSAGRVNHWLGYAFYFGLSPWGAYPGSDWYDVQSGIGMANNALMLDGAEKTVYRAPFHKLIDPYTVRSRRVAEFGRKLAAYDGTTSLASFASLLWTAMRC